MRQTGQSSAGCILRRVALWSGARALFVHRCLIAVINYFPCLGSRRIFRGPCISTGPRPGPSPRQLFPKTIKAQTRRVAGLRTQPASLIAASASLGKDLGRRRGRWIGSSRLYASLRELWICFFGSPVFFLCAGRLHLPAQASPSPLRWNGQMPDLSINRRAPGSSPEALLTGRSLFLQKHFFPPVSQRCVFFFPSNIHTGVKFLSKRRLVLTLLDSNHLLCGCVCNPHRSSATSQQTKSLALMSSFYFFILWSRPGRFLRPLLNTVPA